MFTEKKRSATFPFANNTTGKIVNQERSKKQLFSAKLSHSKFLLGENNKL